MSLNSNNELTHSANKVLVQHIWFNFIINLFLQIVKGFIRFNLISITYIQSYTARKCSSLPKWSLIRATYFALSFYILELVALSSLEEAPSTAMEQYGNIFAALRHNNVGVTTFNLPVAITITVPHRASNCLDLRCTATET